MADGPKVTGTAAGTESGAARFLRPEVLSRIGDLELRARHVVEGFVSGMHRSPYRGYSVEFAEHREYVAGDDVRHIDWRVWGRADRLFIKQYEEETNLLTHLVVDCSASMRYPEARTPERMTKFEYAATLAASLAYLLVHQQDAVGLLLFDRAVQSDLPASASVSHLRAIVEGLSRARTEEPSEAGVLSGELAQRLRRRGLVVLISDLLMDLDTIVESLDRFRFDRHEVIVMHVLDEDERTFPFKEHTRFESLEPPEAMLTTDPQSLRASYLEAVERFVARLGAVCADRAIDYVGLTTTERLDVALRRYLAARAHRLQR